ncbi:MAG: PCP reductase family protein [bacterium]
MSTSDFTEPTIWEEEARERVENAPAFVRTGILKLTEKRARERERSVITSEFLTEIRNESMLRVAKVIKAFGFEDLTLDAFDVAKQKMKKNAHKVEVIGDIETYLAARTEKKDEIIAKFKKYINMIPERGLPWTEEALQRIERAPDFVMKMAESVIEEEAKKRKEKVITKEVVEAALKRVGSAEASTAAMPFLPNFVTEEHNASEADFEVKTNLPWSQAARTRLERIPIEFVRKRIIKRVEKYAARNGLTQVTLEVYEAGKNGSA